jgi:hypothetical protein
MYTVFALQEHVTGLMLTLIQQPDPTNGFVQYLDQTNAEANNLTYASAAGVYLGVDHTNVYPTSGPGRPSVRLQSKARFTKGLFVLDLEHMPYGCGTW